jgi:hypothetical protein
MEYFADAQPIFGARDRRGIFRGFIGTRGQ